MAAVRDSCPCADCGCRTFPGEYYMVQDHLWAEAVYHPRGGLQPIPVRGSYLCIEHLETRLGRELAPADFTSAPINKLALDWDLTSRRLVSRLTGLPPSGEGEKRNG